MSGLPRRSYPNEVHRIIVDLHVRGRSLARIYDSVRGCGITKSGVATIIRKYKSDQQVDKKKRGGDTRGKLEEDDQLFICQLKDEDSDLTLDEIAHRVLIERLISVSVSTISRVLKAHGFTDKDKKLVRSKDKRNSDTTKQMRHLLAQEREELQPPLTDENVVSIDETSIVYPPKRFTVIMAAHPRHGIIHHHTLTTKANAQIFAVFIKDLIETVLPALYPNGVPKHYFLMDNISLHTAPETKAIMDPSIHSIFFTPPYSPMFNFIGDVFQHIKAEMGHPQAQTIIDLEQFNTHLNQVLPHVTPQQCFKYYEDAQEYWQQVLTNPDIEL